MKITERRLLEVISPQVTDTSLMSTTDRRMTKSPQKLHTFNFLTVKS